MIESTCQTFKNWKEHGMEVFQLAQTMQTKISQNSQQPGTTARDTLQHNCLAEIGFATLCGQGRAMTVAAKTPKEWKPLVAQKAFQTATKLDRLLPTTVDSMTKPRAEHWSGSVPSFTNDLQKQGEAGTLKVRIKTIQKLADRETACTFVGGIKDHDGTSILMLTQTESGLLHTENFK